MESNFENPVHAHSEKGPLTIEEIRVLNGANYFSAGPVVVLRLNLGKYNEKFTNTLDGFYDQLESNLPSLYEHHCSEDRPGGFLKRVQDGTLLGHVAEHIAIELQTLAGMDVRFGKTRQTNQEGVYNVVYRFFDEQAGVLAGRAAVNFLNSVLLGNDFSLEKVVKALTNLRETNMPGPGTQAVIDLARSRKIPLLRLDPYSLVQLGTGKHQKRIRATLSSNTSFIAVENVKNSFLSTLMMRNAGIPVPVSLLAENTGEAIEFFRYMGKPVVLKVPVNDKTRSVFPALNDEASIERAFKICSQYNTNVLVQEQIPGELFRLLIINNKFVAATHLSRPEIIGNGKDTIAVLIHKLNEKQGREKGDKASLTAIETDEKLKETLSFYGYQLQTTPDVGLRIILNHHSSPAGGALTSDATGIVHPLNRFIAEKAAEVAGLDVAGVNVICPDISKPIFNGQGVVLNVLAGPDFRMHINPWQGKAREVEEAFLNMIFPHDAPYRIPVFSVTGSAGKSVCAYLINFILEKEGYKSGLAHSDGIFSAGKKIVQGDMAGHHAAKLILKDPGIDCAVLETSVESIIREGLGYEFADFGIVLNAHEQALSHCDLEGADDIAYAQSVVAEEVYPAGFSILNADDANVMEMKDRIYNHIALFTKQADNPVFKEHVLAGGWGAGVKNDNIYLWSKSGKTCISPLSEIPLWAEERNHIYLESLLAAILALAAFDMIPEKIRNHLKAFKPASHNMHGRLIKASLNQNSILIDKPSGPVALEHIRRMVQDNAVHATFYLDQSGNVPEDFAQNFLAVFRKSNANVFIFTSALHAAKRTKKSTGINRERIIISLKEYYLEETAEKPADTLLEEKNGFEKRKAKNNPLKIHYLDDISSFLNQIQTPDPQSLHIIFTWNYPDIQNLLGTQLEYE